MRGADIFFLLLMGFVLLIAIGAIVLVAIAPTHSLNFYNNRTVVCSSDQGWGVNARTIRTCYKLEKTKTYVSE